MGWGEGGAALCGRVLVDVLVVEGGGGEGVEVGLGEGVGEGEEGGVMRRGRRGGGGGEEEGGRWGVRGRARL